jgi:hypothetical protein
MIVIDAKKETDGEVLSIESQNYLTIAFELNVPILIVISKIDLLKDVEDLITVKGKLSQFIMKNNDMIPPTFLED